MISHIKTVNKVNFSKETKIGRTTLYELLDTDREFNPNLSTVTAVISAIEAERKAV